MGAQMEDYAQIMNVVSRFMMTVDERDWDGLRGLMTDPFHADFSSLTGKPAMDATPEAFTQLWDRILSPYRASHHQIGNQTVEIDGSRAEFRSHVTATHMADGSKGSEIETLFGSYRIPLVRSDNGWKLAGVAFTLSFKTGSTG